MSLDQETDNECIRTIISGYLKAKRGLYCVIIYSSNIFYTPAQCYVEQTHFCQASVGLPPHQFKIGKVD